MTGRKTGFDFPAFKDAFERKDAKRWTGFYAEDAEWIEYKPSAPPSDPVRMAGRESMAAFLASLEGSGIEISLSDEVLGGERAAFSVDVTLADGRHVFEHTILPPHRRRQDSPTGRRGSLGLGRPVGDTDREAFESWLAAYGRAWEARDPRAAADLFSEDATYRETPFDESARGREAIADYWSRVTAGHEGVRFGHEFLAVADDTGIARWWASIRSIRPGKPVELDGIFVLRMGADGLCEEVREWWHYRERDVERG